jgi:hypothetical protein
MVFSVTLLDPDIIFLDVLSLPLALLSGRHVRFA